jgi:NAD(P)-dependent dehydrogenase (short-subunit alcohol dehydrogenase family)
MTRGILIAGNESPSSAAIAAEAKKRVKVAATAFIPNRFGGEPVDSVSAVRTPLPEDAALVWNPAGPVSSRALVVAAENRLGRIDEAILVCTPPALRRRADELAPAEIDALVDDLVKGWFFLVRELALVFRPRKAGTLALVLSEAGLGGAKEEATDLVGASIAASYRAFAQGLLASSFAEPYRVLAFSSSEAGDDEAFAAFVFKILDEANKRDSGKWHKYGRGGLFGLR